VAFKTKRIIKLPIFFKLIQISAMFIWKGILLIIHNYLEWTLPGETLILKSTVNRIERFYNNN
jgi:hypothetical protein